MVIKIFLKENFCRKIVSAVNLLGFKFLLYHLLAIGLYISYLTLLSLSFLIYKNGIIRKLSVPWLVWLSGLSAGLGTKEWLVRFPVRAHAWVVGQVSSWVCVKRQPHSDVSLLLFLPPFHSKK